MRHITRGGRYYRALGPSSLWRGRPDDPSFSKKYGGRWNPKGEFGALYLAADLETARANGIHIFKRLFGTAVAIDDLADPETFFEIQAFDVIPSPFIDAITERGRSDLSMPERMTKGAGYEQSQELARDAYQHGELGVAYASAVHEGGEELAVFDTHVPAIVRPYGRRKPFRRFTASRG